MADAIQSIKKPKKQGPIRFEFIIPIAIIIGLMYAYFYFFFDSHLRRAMEWVGTQANGAEVNVREFKTSFFKGTLFIGQIEVTDKSQPTRNFVQIGEIRFGLVWDALLRAKFVINEAVIDNIQVHTPRAKPGRVLPPPDKSDSSLMTSVEAKLTEDISSRINGSALGDLAAVLGGVNVNEQLKTIQASLKAEGHIKQVGEFITEKQKVWDERLKNLPQTKEFDALSAEAKKLKFDGNALEVAQSIAKADQLIKKADSKVKEYTKAKGDLDSDMKNLNASVADIEKFIQQDISDLQNRLKLPSLDAGEISKDLFLSYVGKYMVQYQKYSAMAMQYLPPKKSKEQIAEEQAQAISPRERAEGRSIHFPITRGYPLFHLKRAAISSKADQGPYAGNASGEIIDVTSHPAQLGRPIVVNFAGDFPNSQVLGIKAQAVLDHTTENAKQSLEASVDSYPVQGLMLSDSPDAMFGLKTASGQVDIEGLNTKDGISFKVLNNFNSIDYDVSSKDKTMDDVLNQVAKDISIITVRADISGKLDGLKILIDSNFGRELGASLKRQLDAKIKEAQAQVRKFVDDKIKTEKAKVEGQLAAAKSKLDTELNSKKAELDKAKKDIESQVKGGQKSGSKKSAPKPEDAAKKLLGL